MLREQRFNSMIDRDIISCLSVTCGGSGASGGGDTFVDIQMHVVGEDTCMYMCI